MDRIQLLISAALVTGTLGLSVRPLAAQDPSVTIPGRSGDYCHMKFPAMREGTLSSKQPMLKDGGDIIDFYGPCDHDPTGRHEIQEQEIQMQHRRHGILGD